MANKVLLKKSSVAAKIPLTTDLDYGELALNYTDGKLYFKTANNSVASFDSAAQASWTRVTSNVTAINGSRIIADTTGGQFTVTLPASPSEGHSLTIADGGNWATNPLIVARNGSTIEGLSENLNLDIANIQVEFAYSNGSWQVYAFTGPGVSIINDNVTDTTQYISMTRSTAGDFGSSYVSSTKLYYNPSTGQLNATNFNSLSDASLKTNVNDLPITTNTFDLITSIRPVTFNWKDNGKLSYGVIAQEIEHVLPNIVETNSDTGIKSVSYTQLIPILLQAIKELKIEVDTLKAANG
jgi:hypothetical protein